MAINITKSRAIQILDKIIQLWACSKPSQVSGLHAQCGHHIIHRDNYLFRWNTHNIMPLTFEEHYNIHTNGKDYKNEEQALFVEKNKNLSFKNYLLEKGLTFNEFLEQKLFKFTKKQYKIVEKQKQESEAEKQRKEKLKELKKYYYKQLKEQNKIKRYN